jgi:hypothetical protein
MTEKEDNFLQNDKKFSTTPPSPSLFSRDIYSPSKMALNRKIHYEQRMEMDAVT